MRRVEFQTSVHNPFLMTQCNINCINMNIILFYFFFCLVSNLVNGTTVAEGLNVAGLVLLSGSKGCFYKCFQVLRTRATSNLNSILLNKFEPTYLQFVIGLLGIPGLGI